MVWKGRNESRRTTMNEQQREGTLGGTPLVYVMHAQFAKPIYRDAAREHRERVQLALMRTPVVPVLPPADEPLDVGEWRAIGPLGCVDLVRQASVIELTNEQGEGVIWDGNFEGLFNAHGG